MVSKQPHAKVACLGIFFLALIKMFTKIRNLPHNLIKLVDFKDFGIE